MALIYHIALDRDWRDAQAAGEYRVSTRGRTLEEEGFIHCSDAHQVAAVANSFYTGAAGLVLLTIDSDRLSSELRYERVAGADEAFPHVHGPLDVNAVIRVSRFEPGADGTFAFE
jgi:glutathione S-transferase